MKKIYILLFSFCFLNIASSQYKIGLDSAKFSVDSTYFITPQKDTIYLIPQINAGFWNGQEGWNKFLMDNINEGVAEINGAKKGIYPVQALFVIDNEGKIVAVELINNPGFGTGEELVRVLMLSPPWVPAQNYGHLVQSVRFQNFSFEVNYENIKDTAQRFVREDSALSNPQIEAAFPGGQEGWRKYLEQNLKREVAENNGAPPGTYTVKVSFIVKKDGSISNIEVLKNPGYGTAEEVVRIIKKCPKWNPGIQNGKEVISIRAQTISFQVQ